MLSVLHCGVFFSVFEILSLLAYFIRPTGLCVARTFDGIKSMNMTRAIKDCKNYNYNTSTEDKEIDTQLPIIVIVV